MDANQSTPVPSDKVYQQTRIPFCVVDYFPNNKKKLRKWLKSLRIFEENEDEMIERLLVLKTFDNLRLKEYDYLCTTVPRNPATMLDFFIRDAVRAGGIIVYACVDQKMLNILLRVVDGDSRKVVKLFPKVFETSGYRLLTPKDFRKLSVAKLSDWCGGNIKLAFTVANVLAAHFLPRLPCEEPREVLHCSCGGPYINQCSGNFHSKLFCQYEDTHHEIPPNSYRWISCQVSGCPREATLFSVNADKHEVKLCKKHAC